MSISIYYTARRERPLSANEQTSIERLCAKYSIRDQVERRAQTGRGHNGMDFYIYDPVNPTEPEIILEGSTQLPDNSQDDLWEMVQHWCNLLSELRQALSSAEWHVHIDDHDIAWDNLSQAYDPSV